MYNKKTFGCVAGPTLNIIKPKGFHCGEFNVEQ